MARRSRGLGAGSKTALRPFAQLAKHLGPAERGRLESAFADAEDLLNFHSANIPEKLQRRSISGLVQQIVIDVTASTLGAFVSWERLGDPKISLYEIQVSDDNVFSNPETFTSVDTFFAIEGATTAKFIRVRGVRLDGEAGVWSETGSAVPNITAPAAFSVEFYPLYLDGEDPRVQRTVVYGGDTDPEAIPTFYTLLADSFYADRLNGGLSIWGYVSNRLRRFTDPGKTPWDRVRFTVNGIHRMDAYFPHWTNAFSETSANATDKDSSGRFVTFYAKGGYTAAFGPYGVSVPNTLAGFGPRDAYRVTSQDAVDGSFYWNFPLNARYPSRFDQAQLLSFSDGFPAHESTSVNIEKQQKSHYLIFQDFKMNVPPTSRILGIQADVKRRQPNQRDDEVSANLGVVRPDKSIGQDFVLEHMATGGAGNANATSAYVLEDVNFGKYLDLTVGKGPTGSSSGRLVGDPSGIGNNGALPATLTTIMHSGDSFSISAWGIATSPTSNLGNFLANLGDPTAGVSSNISLTMTTEAAPTNAVTAYNFTVQQATPAGGIAEGPGFVAVGSTRNLNAFHHVVATWNRNTGVNGALRLYVDGVLRATTSTTAAFKNNFVVGRRRAMGIGGISPTLGGTAQSVLGQAQTAFWSTELSAAQVAELFTARGYADYRFNFGKYTSSRFLDHYFLYFPDQANVKDQQIRLVDFTGVRTDLDNKAITTESWPQLGEFFYTTVRQYDVLPLASSDGIPHDNHTAIGYQTYGGPTDLWGAASWSPSEVNDFYFGIAVQALNDADDFFRGNAFVDHARLTVYTEPERDRETTVEISVAAANQFYIEREFFGGLLNIIEIGEKVALLD